MKGAKINMSSSVVNNETGDAEWATGINSFFRDGRLLPMYPNFHIKHVIIMEAEDIAADYLEQVTPRTTGGQAAVSKAYPNYAGDGNCSCMGKL
jgi:hypothetical protein